MLLKKKLASSSTMNQASATILLLLKKTHSIENSTFNSLNAKVVTICRANQFTGFHMMTTLVFNE